ncbi:uncharacterized protein LOC112563086 isoform X3 [Pomacea canaliculata]|nr:uncharacterized protein LOC112563086 isoform X3 [Pomacea canaliculata]
MWWCNDPPLDSCLRKCCDRLPGSPLALKELPCCVVCQGPYRNPDIVTQADSYSSYCQATVCTQHLLQVSAVSHLHFRHCGQHQTVLTGLSKLQARHQMAGMPLAATVTPRATTPTTKPAAYVLHIAGCSKTCAVWLIVSLTVFLVVLLMLSVLLAVLLYRRHRRRRLRRLQEEECARRVLEAQACAMTPEMYLRENLAYSHVGDSLPPPYSQPLAIREGQEEEEEDQGEPKPPSDDEDDDQLLEADPPPTYEEATEFVCAIASHVHRQTNSSEGSCASDLIQLDDQAPLLTPPLLSSLTSVSPHATLLTFEAIIEARPDDLGDDISDFLLQPFRDPKDL